MLKPKISNLFGTFSVFIYSLNPKWQAKRKPFLLQLVPGGKMTGLQGSQPEMS